MTATANFNPIAITARPRSVELLKGQPVELWEPVVTQGHRMLVMGCRGTEADALSDATAFMWSVDQWGWAVASDLYWRANKTSSAGGYCEALS